MTEEPSFPEDVNVSGGPATRGEGGEGGEAARQPMERRRKKQIVGAGVAVGIGSAAIVAALLYANRGKKNDKGGNG